MKETYIVKKDESGIKLIDVLFRRFELSIRQLRRAKKSRLVRVNGHKISLNAALREGDVVELVLEDEENIFSPEPIRFGVLYEDEYLLAADKPPFLVVHPTKGHQSNTLGNAVAYHMAELGDEYKIRFINRLDRDTSGVVLIAKNALAQQRITEQMQKGAVKKQYLALVEGVVEESGEIDMPIGRASDDDVLRVVRPDGKRAVTKYRRVRVIGDYSLVQVELITGRTHQIRVHFKAIGHPIVGDPLYGGGVSSPYIGRQALHCFSMSFSHPQDGSRICVEAPIPADIAQAIRMIESFGGC